MRPHLYLELLGGLISAEILYPLYCRIKHGRKVISAYFKVDLRLLRLDVLFLLRNCRHVGHTRKKEFILWQ